MYKKFLSILVVALMVMSLLPAGILAASAKRPAPAEQQPAPAEQQPAAEKAAVAFGWDFESDDLNADGWRFVDMDQDGHSWQWVDFSQSSDAPITTSGVRSIKSYSYQNNQSYTPDNWAVTPAIEVPNWNNMTATLTYQVASHLSGFQETYGLYISTNGSNFTALQEGLTTPTSTRSFEQRSVDLTAYAGQTIYIAFRHYDCEDQYAMYIDDVFFSAQTGFAPSPTVNEIHVAGLRLPPVVGQAAGDNLDISYPVGQGYTLRGAYWRCDSTSSSMQENDVFEAGKRYSCCMMFDPEPGCTFANTVNCYIDGSTEYVSNTQGLDSTGYYFFWTKIIDPVAEINLDEALNVAGGTLHFESAGNYPWEVVEQGGRLYAKSTNEGASSSASYLNLTATVAAGDVISFDFKAWGEGSSTAWDKCIFRIDGAEIFSYGARQNDWERFTSDPLTAGEHNFEWVYSKDSSVNPTGDYFAIDEVEITEGGEPPVTEPPEPTPVPENLVVGFYFESNPAEEGWQFVDADGDGNNWYWLAYGINQDTGNMAYEGVGHLTSASYLGTALTPDNWAISPEFEVPAVDPMVSMYIGAQDPSYAAEHYTVYVGNGTDVESYTAISDEVVVEGTYAKVELDLADYAGETVSIAVRHFNCTDMFRINLDCVEVFGSNEEPEPDPIVIDTVEVIDFDMPVFGSNPDFDVSVPEGAPYTVTLVEWYNGHGSLADDFVFVPGAYYVVFEFAPNEGYVFGEVSETTMLINGSSELVMSYYCFSGSDSFHIETVDLLVEEPEADIIGDADGDGEVTTADALLALRYVMGLDELDEEQLAQADVDGDGEVTMIDCLLIQRYVMGVIAAFPIDNP